VVHSPLALEYWKKKDNMTDSVLGNINWDAIGAAMKETKRSARVLIAKHVSGMCGVGKFMKRWKLRQDDICPRCEETEDAAHVWTCQGEGANEIWNKSLEDLEQWMNINYTNPDLQHLLLTQLSGWRDNSQTSASYPFIFNELLQHQSDIGWNRFFEGWLSHEWLGLQQAYYSAIKSRRSGIRWTVALILKLWDIAWDLWEHRNGVLYSKDNTVAEREERAIDKAVIDVFNKLQSMLLSPHDRHLTDIRLGKLLKKNMLYKEVWLRQASTVTGTNRIQQCNRVNHITGMRRCMTRFLQRAPT
jgi:hypothetical protein